MHSTLSYLDCKKDLERSHYELLQSCPPHQTHDIKQDLRMSLESIVLQFQGDPVAPREGGPFEYKRAIDAMSHAYVETDERGIIRRTNKALIELFGLRREQRLTGWPLLLFIEHEDRSRFFDELFSARRPNVLYTAGQTFRIGLPNEPRPRCYMNARGLRGIDGTLNGIVWLLGHTN